ncbi:MAG: hypothetical protein LUF34_04075 [Lachnospiraceae bacterium]|nr:hypothetical protein [Lachnospiraceae bacterium]
MNEECRSASCQMKALAQRDVQRENAPKASRSIKDSVFRNLFSEKKYMLQLYQALHPEDMESTADDLECVTLEQVLVHDIYNDLGFRVGNRLLILIEAQSLWTVNIIPRCMMYLARTYQEYFRQSTQSLFSTSPVKMPEPELCVIYTGKTRVNREYISLSEEFFGGRQTALELRVRVITDGQDGDIINQYVVFTKVIDDQVRIYGRTREAVKEAIRICKDRNILREYLGTREKEVVDIMVTLYDQQQVWEEYVASERKKVTEETAEYILKESAENFYKNGVSVDVIARSLNRPAKTIQSWLGLLPQT